EAKLHEGAMRPGQRWGLYPPGYGGMSLYPPQDWIPGGADAITYMPKKDLQFKFLKSWKSTKESQWMPTDKGKSILVPGLPQFNPKLLP
ncbi:hypothetical protein ABI011_14775, partial [Enterococcus faecium]|uniref:hypothetical protein n=1 Tax=Enterococcus faecium TaxID=1352 RepID=UPI003F41F041